MRISCQSCAAKYTIADEKVVGKVIKIKCKKCSSTIVVNGNDPGALAQLQADGAGFEDQAATQLLSQPAPGMMGPAADEWTVSAADDDQRAMTTAQLVSEYQAGALNADTYVWRDGMGDWQPIQQVPELMSLIAGGAAAPAAAAYQAPANGSNPYAAPAPTPMMAPVAAASAPATAAATAAARRSGARGSNVDLFGAGGGGGDDRAAPAASPSDKHIGERNETSVLFSLKDLGAAEAAAAAKPEKKASTYDSRKSDRVDDILSLGGASAAPMLAPPSMHAPFVEPPPPPPPPSMPPPSMGMAGPAYAQMAPPPQKSSPVPFIVGGVGVLALLGGIGFFVLGGKETPKPEPAKTVAAETKTAEPAKTAEPTKTADPIATATTEPSSTATADSTAKSSDAPSSTGALVKNDATKTDPKKEDPKKEDPKKEDPKKEEPPAAGGDAPFDRGAASAALSGAAGAAKGCAKADGPTGSTKVQVTFAPSGKATQAVVGAPFAGTSVGSCIAGAFKGARVPPFSGAPVTVSKTVSIK
jgi:predicted Zn finger-like uncharacterized protein